jgi:methyl-accepting chemotaxis protein
MKLLEIKEEKEHFFTTNNKKLQVPIMAITILLFGSIIALFIFNIEKYGFTSLIGFMSLKSPIKFGNYIPKKYRDHYNNMVQEGEHMMNQFNNYNERYNRYKRMGEEYVNTAQNIAQNVENVATNVQNTVQNVQNVATNVQNTVQNVAQNTVQNIATNVQNAAQNVAQNTQPSIAQRQEWQREWEQYNQSKQQPSMAQREQWQQQWNEYYRRQGQRN